MAGASSLPSVAPSRGSEEISAELQAASREISSSRKEPDWVRQFRREALETYLSLPLPDRVGHLWRYTDPKRFLPARPGAFSSLPGNGTSKSREVEWPAELGRLVDSGQLAGAVLTTGGTINRVFLDPALKSAGLVMEDLHEAASSRSELVRASLGTSVPASMGKFEALNAALWQGGLLIHIPRGVEVEKPIHISRILGKAPVELSRLLIIAEANSEVTLIDECTGGGGADPANGPVQANSAVEILVKGGARVRYVAVQRFDPGVNSHLAQRGRLLADSKLVSVFASLGGSTSKADLGTVLEGRGAEIELLGFLFAHGRQHFDHHTVHDHRVGNTLSNLDFKVVLRDRSRSAYTGLIRIAPGASNSEAYQENRNLILNDGAKVDSIPELEILTDEVMCTHGATMGPVDPEQIFYLTSRGIPYREARQIIVAGFIEPTLQRIPADLRDRLRTHIEAGLSSI